MSTAAKRYEIDPQLLPNLPVDIVYQGRRTLNYVKRTFTFYTYMINESYYAQLATKRWPGRHRVGDLLHSTTDAAGYVRWLSCTKIGRVPDREASVLAIQERVSLGKRQKNQNKQHYDSIRDDLQRYRNLYLLAHNDEARASVLASVIAAIVS